MDEFAHLGDEAAPGEAMFSRHGLAVEGDTQDFSALEHHFPVAGLLIGSFPRRRCRFTRDDPRVALSSPLRGTWPSRGRFLVELAIEQREFGSEPR